MSKTRPFKNPKRLALMLSERRDSASLLWLSKKYRCHHTTILFHCKKSGVVPEVPLRGGRKKITLAIRYTGVSEDQLDALEQALLPMEDGPINKGKTYDEYIREAMEKQKDFRHYFERFHVNPIDFEYTKNDHVHLIPMQ